MIVDKKYEWMIAEKLCWLSWSGRTEAEQGSGGGGRRSFFVDLDFGLVYGIVQLYIALVEEPTEVTGAIEQIAETQFGQDLRMKNEFYG